MSTLPGMPHRLWTASPSKLATWLDCPRRFRLRYLERGVPTRAWAHQSLGAATHNALRDWWQLPRQTRTPSAAAALVRTGWIAEGFRDDAQCLRWREQAASWVATYTQTLDADDEPAGVERTVGTTTPVLALSGRVDRIDRRRTPDGEEYVVVDYKTGRRVPDEGEARSSLALATYAVATARTLRRPCRRVELHHLPTGAIAAWEHTSQSLDRHLRRADEIGAEARDAQAALQAARDEVGGAGVPPGVVDGLFPPRPGSLCAWCDVRSSCPEGCAVGPPAVPWAGLPDAGDDAPLPVEGVVPDDSWIR